MDGNSPNPREAIGGNNPPTDAQMLTDLLTENHAKLLERRDALLDASARVPDTIEDDDQANKVADFIKQIAACVKNADAARVSEKEPYLEGGRRVDGFFKAVTDTLGATKKAVEAKLTAYQRRKADEERRRREEEARRQQEEAERLRKEAEERAAAMAKPEDLDEAIAADDAAKRQAAEADHAQRDAQANAADLSRNRSDHGTVASLRTVWTFADLDRVTLDLEALRPHLPSAALEIAVRSFIKAGGRELPGVRIFEDYSTVVR